MSTPDQPGAEPVVAAQEPEERRGLSTAVKVGVVLVGLAGAVGALLFGSMGTEALVYSKLVDEVVKSPAAFKGRELRVEGDLKTGSIKFREDPCEWRFVISKGETEMPVRFPQCIVPDTFRDGMGISVTVQGKLEDEGFLASQVIPKCPSKYEMKQKAKKGETMPHATPMAINQDS